MRPSFCLYERLFHIQTVAYLVYSELIFSLLSDQVFCIAKPTNDFQRTPSSTTKAEQHCGKNVESRIATERSDGSSCLKLIRKNWR